MTIKVPPTVTHCRKLLQGTRFEVVPMSMVRLLPDALMVLEEFVAHAKRGGPLNAYLRELVADAEGVLERVDGDTWEQMD